MMKTSSPRGQPSAPPIESFRRWQPPPATVATTPSTFTYVERRPRPEPNFLASKSSSRSSGSTAESPIALSTISNPYDSPERHSVHTYGPAGVGAPLYGSPVRSRVGPPIYMAGGGFDIPPGVLPPHKNSGGIYALQSYPAPGMRYFGRDSEDEQHTPWLSVALALGYVVVFIMTMQCNNCPANIDASDVCLLPFLHKFSFQPLRENPLLGPSAKTLLGMGALESELVTKAREGWRMLASMGLHAGVFHITGNLLGLLVLGIPLERELGYAKVGFIYLFSGFAGSVLSALFLHGRVSVGASGAVMGLLGATLSSLLVNWGMHRRRRAQALLAVVFFAALDIVFGLLPLVDNFVHGGGAVTGFLLGNLLLVEHDLGWVARRCFRPAVVYDVDDMPVKSKNTVFLNAAWVLSLCILVAGITMGLFALYTGMNIGKGCTWCRYLTCLPTNLWKCSGDSNVGCNLSSIHGYLRVTCANNATLDWPSVPYFDQLSPQVQGLCIKSCIGV